MIQIIDNWHPDPHALRKQALEGAFVSVDHGGTTFHGIQEVPFSAPDKERLSRCVAKDSIEGRSSFRLYTKDMPQPTMIHNDSELGRWTGILYLNEKAHGGTAFWRPALPIDGIEQVWKQTAQIQGLWNRLIVFDSSLWHSRWPEHVTEGATPETGRLIQLFFFS
jgi:hypothetical protein